MIEIEKSLFTGVASDRSWRFLRFHKRGLWTAHYLALIPLVVWASAGIRRVHRAFAPVVDFALSECSPAAPVSNSRRTLHSLFVIVCLATTLPGSASNALANEDCVYPNALRTLRNPPERRLGDYRVELTPPNFGSRISVQEHWKYSIMLGSLLKDALPNASHGLCDVDVDAAYYPDLHAHLTRRSVVESLDSDRSRCSRALLDALRQVNLDETQLRELAQRIIKTTIHWLAPVSVLNEARANLWDSLAYIYDANTVMGALVTLKLSELNSVDLRSFLSWLDHQKVRRNNTLIPWPVCTARPEGRVPGDSTRRQELQSGVVLPKVVKLTSGSVGISTRRPLRHMAVVGVSREQAAERLFRVCEDLKVNIPSSRNLNADGTAVVQIKCTQMSPVYTDWWLAFYCDPNDCHSEAEEKAAVGEFVASYDQLKFLGYRSVGVFPTAPYLIEIEASPK